MSSLVAPSRPHPRPSRALSPRLRAPLAACAALLAVSAARIASAQSIADIAAQGRCENDRNMGLSNQLVAMQMCMTPGAFVAFTPHANVRISDPTTYAYLSAPARDALWRASDSLELEVNSAFRTIADQYVLYYSHGCELAAEPGQSNHETGRALDLQNWSAAIGPMTAAGCTHTYPSTDPVHFDCPGDDMRADSIRAFQHLWNQNHPEDLIDEDGIYGPATNGRLAGAPANGFANPGSCTPAWGAQFVSQSFPVAADPPIVLHVGESRAGYIEMRNVGSSAWDASTRLGTTGPRDRTSPLAGDDWTTPGRPASATGSVAMGASYRFSFMVHGNAVGSYDEHFGMLEEGLVWFSDPNQGGPPDTFLELRVEVIPAEAVDAGAGRDAAVDARERAGDAGLDARRLPDGALDPERAMGGCGCEAAGRRVRGGAWLALSAAVAASVATRRRRRIRIARRRHDRAVEPFTG